MSVRCAAARFGHGPSFLRPRAIYTLRVVQKAVEAVYHDRMAMRCVPDRLARDFWVKPAEKMVRLWCRAFADRIDFAIDYQLWVVANFSGILCVDEVYQGDLALLLAVDPAAPDGDRLVGYTLLPKAREVDQGSSRPSSTNCEPLVLRPTTSSQKIRGCTRRCWPTPGRRRCTNCACSKPRVGLSARSVMLSITSGDRCRRHPLPANRPCSAPCVPRRRQLTDQHDADSERYRCRLARRTLGIAQAQALHQHISSARAIGRQLGINHGTVRQWLKLTPPDAATIAELSSTTGVLPIVEPPPAPWKDWDEVRSVREDLRLYRTLFLHQPENLTTEERQKLADLSTGPVGAELRAARTFLEEWFAIWQDELGNRRTSHDAERQYLVWQTDAEAAKVAPLRRQQQHLDLDHFIRLSAFLRDPTWEPTNNAAERVGAHSVMASARTFGSG
jgi:hypothetical protein